MVGPGRKKTSETVIFNTIIGENLNYIRKKNEITLVELGKECNVQFQQVQKYISGQNAPHTMTLKRFADFFDVTMDDLCNPNFIELYKQGKTFNFIKKKYGKAVIPGGSSSISGVYTFAVD
jgi:transcriptional regulator with XRE-family HTH domain